MYLYSIGALDISYRSLNVSAYINTYLPGLHLLLLETFSDMDPPPTSCMPV